MKKKLVNVTLVLLLICSIAIAEERCEIDAVGCDASNVFNGPIEEEVVLNSMNYAGEMINYWSFFSEENFRQSAGRLEPDPCFGFLGDGGYESALSDAFRDARFVWDIVLQMKPTYDINLEINSCVMKHNSGFDIWKTAAQSGYYLAPSGGEAIFIPNCSPVIKVKAFPGPYATPDFVSPFLLDTRLVPTLEEKMLKKKKITLNGLWETTLVIKLPVTGEVNAKGQTTYALKQGDRIKVKIEIPGSSLNDICFGPDAVKLKYIGIVGTEYLSYGQCP